MEFLIPTHVNPQKLIYDLAKDFEVKNMSISFLITKKNGVIETSPMLKIDDNTGEVPEVRSFVKGWIRGYTA